MYSKHAHNQYKTVSVSTVDRGRLLLMLYDGCLNFLRQAKAGLEARDLPKFARFLSKSQAIISQLISTLDYERGGKIAKDLYRIYDFIMFHLTEANLQKDPRKVAEAIEVLEKIVNAYHDIIECGKLSPAELEPEARTETKLPEAKSATAESTETTQRLRISL